MDAELFDGLSALTTLNLYSNELSTLPSGIFEGLTALTTLDLSGNTVDPLPLTVSLDKVADAEFKGTAPAGAPFAIELPVSATNGTIDNSVTAITVPIGSVESSSVTVTRTSGTTDPVTVDIGVLPSLPANHQGYELVKSDDLPLTVIDAVGNNVPVFDTGLNTTPSIAENTVAGTNIGTPLTATDADTEDTLTYSIDATSDAVFDIESTSGQLKTEAALDYEDTDSYTVTVTVSDGTNDATIDVTISITNVNEAPAFATETTTRSIPENTAANTNIGTVVTATDPDIAGTNADANPETSTADTLTYSIDATSDTVFDIDSTGQLKTKAALDYETQSSYKVTVEVSDGRGGTDTIDVTINITDVDETLPNNAPTFTEGTSTTRSVAENTAANQNIGSPVSAMDQDNDPLTYSLKAHNADADDYQAFSIATSTGQLKTKNPLDYETQSSYKVTVEVSDGRGGTDTVNVTINVTDVDEAPPNSAPVFTSDSTTRSIGETTRAGVKIGAPVTATDPDGDTLTYSLEGTDAASFNIDRSTGQLKTKAALDRNIKRRYTVIVKASDGKGGTDTITVTINVRKPDRPQPIMVARQNGVEEKDQVVKPGTFQLIMGFDQPVTGFDRSDLKIHDFRTGATFSGWQGSSGGTEYTATFTGASEGVITFTVPENAAQAADDGQGNAEWKLTVWVTESGEHNLGAPMGGKEIPYPDVTLLLPSYPNPFNPETWIPYQLAHDADVEIRIYDVRGMVVRRLVLGHQSAGFYTNRTRAAYWDGRNSFGEDVANGVYFYQLRAGDISPPRKMLMLK